METTFHNEIWQGKSAAKLEANFYDWSYCVMCLMGVIGEE